MKKKILFILLIVSSLLTVSCNSSSNITNSQSNRNFYGFEKIDTIVNPNGGFITIYVDNATYIIYIHPYKGSVTTMLDYDGKPLTYEKYNRLNNMYKGGE